jgi:hypothetical protein
VVREGGRRRHSTPHPSTVKRVDEVVRYLHRVTQDQFSLVSEKVSGIHEDNFTVNIELFWQNVICVELLRYKRNAHVAFFL